MIFFENNYINIGIYKNQNLQVKNIQKNEDFNSVERKVWEIYNLKKGECCK